MGCNLCRACATYVNVGFNLPGVGSLVPPELDLRAVEVQVGATRSRAALTLIVGAVLS